MPPRLISYAQARFDDYIPMLAQRYVRNHLLDQHFV